MAPGKNIFVHWHIRRMKNQSSALHRTDFLNSIFGCSASLFCRRVWKNSKGVSEDELIPLEKVEVLTVDSRDKAESLAKTLEDSGYRSIVVAEDLGGKQVYKVFILVHKGEQIPDSSGGRHRVQLR